jgi:alkylhydroperoxidase/carboxymuconolactone decarboxylase family protein YurZ
MPRHTKIVATLGPASSTPEVLERMVRAGVDVVRMNFSHGTAEDHLARAAGIRAAALKLGLTPRAIVEILIQIGIYRGFAASETALETALAVFAEEGITLEPDAPRNDSLEVLMARGRGLQAALHAERRHEGHAAPDNPVTGGIYPLVVQYCYGEIWDRPGLDRRVRAICAVASFAALDHDILLRKFILSALNIGASRGDIVEALIQGGHRDADQGARPTALSERAWGCAGR